MYIMHMEILLWLTLNERKEDVGYFCDSSSILDRYLYSLHTSLFMIDDSPAMTGVYFLCRLKINHDSHEFILKFGTGVNNNLMSQIL
jgi:hypothetical protein